MMTPQRFRDGTASHGMDIYLREINRIPLLRRDEEAEIARRAKNGDPNALDQLVQANLRFVVSIAKQYANLGVPLEDLVNDGNIGLMRAAQRFDVDRGFKFITYAVWWIRQAMLQSLADHSRIVRMPMNRAGLLYRINRATRDMAQDLGREPTPREIAEALDVPEAQVRETILASAQSVSLDEPMAYDGDDSRLGEFLVDESSEDTDTQALQSTLSADLQKAIETLTEREQVILSKYFGLQDQQAMTLEAIGKEIGLTRERVRQIKEKALERLRHHSRAQFLHGHHESS